MKNTKNSKRKIIGTILLIMILAFIQAAFAVSMEQNASRYSKSSGMTDLEVMSTRYEPYPAQPGRYIDVWVKIENRGTNDIANAQIQLTPKYPFSLDENEAALRTLGKLTSFQAAVVNFKVRVDNSAVLGNNPLGFEYRENIDGIWNDGSFNVFIQPRDLNLQVENIAVSPEKIAPGEKGKVTFTLKNYGDSSAENIKIRLGLLDSSIPLVAANTLGEKTIDEIRSGEKKDVSIDVIALADASAKIYKIPIGLQYYDTSGKTYNITNVFAMSISEKPNIYFISDSTTLAGDKTAGDITIKAVNPSASDIKFMDIELLPSDNYEILSASRVYIGKVDSDDYGSADFSIYLKDSKNMEFIVPIKATYHDATNEEYTTTEDVKVSFAKAKYDAKSSGSGASTLIFAIVVIGAGYFFYRRWKKKKEGEKKK